MIGDEWKKYTFTLETSVTSIILNSLTGLHKNMNV
jgi:hypothetical protein